MPALPLLAVTQGDPAGVGPELLLRLLAGGSPDEGWRPLLVAERAALDAVADRVEGAGGLELRYLTDPPAREELARLAPGVVPVLDPVGVDREVRPGSPTAEDARAALAALDAATALALSGAVDGLVTAPVAKASIAEHAMPGFRGHTDTLAAAAGLERYGRDYLMAFLAPDLQVALLTTHLPLAEAIGAISSETIVEALLCLDRHAGGRIAVAGLNPHAGEGGLLGKEDGEIVAPAVARARAAGIDARGPESPDSLFARARGGEFDWVLALYHDQGLIAVKTAAFGRSLNWTLGLPFVRTSVDHGTAYGVAAGGGADAGPLREAVRGALDLLAGRLPRRRRPKASPSR